MTLGYEAGGEVNMLFHQDGALPSLLSFLDSTFIYYLVSCLVKVMSTSATIGLSHAGKQIR